MGKILVTGGCGYIGSHTIVDLVANNFEVVCADNNIRSTDFLLKRVQKLTGVKIPHLIIDLCDLAATREIFNQYSIDGIVHFAALKSVDESVKHPLLYFHNNLVSQANVLQCTEEFKVPFFVFSSSCSVYGNTTELPVSEETALASAESPYGMTKQIGEDMIREIAKVSATKFALLRYFNPAGAHVSAAIGEVPFGRPSNLVPAITQFAAGRIPTLKVYGTDYDTRDGSCIRDLIHVSDIGQAHTRALEHLSKNKDEHYCEIFNLGTGNGVTVLEAIKAFEKVSGLKLDVDLAPRRPGDVIAVYASNTKAKAQLGWVPKYNLEDIMATAWEWENIYHSQLGKGH